MNFLQTELGKAGFGNIGRACGVTRQAVRAWWFIGKLPDTEQLPETHPRRTNHAKVISKMVKCKPEQLL